LILEVPCTSSVTSWHKDLECSLPLQRTNYQSSLMIRTKSSGLYKLSNYWWSLTFAGDPLIKKIIWQYMRLIGHMISWQNKSESGSADLWDKGIFLTNVRTKNVISIL
jgi:hypothetical protein